MNPASRLNDLVEFFNSANPNGAIKEAWEKYMGSASMPLTEDEVLDFIQAVLAEIRAMEAKLKDIGAPSNLYTVCHSTSSRILAHPASDCMDPSSRANAQTSDTASTSKVAEVADKGSKTIKFGKEFYELGTTAWKFVQGLLT